jgi:hypothetical protein
METTVEVFDVEWLFALLFEAIVECLKVMVGCCSYCMIFAFIDISQIAADLQWQSSWFWSYGLRSRGHGLSSTDAGHLDLAVGFLHTRSSRGVLGR